MLKRFVKFRFLRILIRVILGLLIFFSAVVLFIRSPWGQDIIVTRAVKYVSGKTGTKVEIDRLYLTFSGNLSLEGLYLEDLAQDTLVYSEALEVSVALWPAIRGEEINVNYLKWEGLRANVIREKPEDPFNYQFLIDAFVPESTTAVPDTTTTASPAFNIGDIVLKDIDLLYDDALTGMKADVIIGQLDLELNSLDLDSMVFDVGELALKQTRLDYSQVTPPASTLEENVPVGDPATTAMPLPRFMVDELTLSEVSVNYESVVDGLTMTASVEESLLQMPLMDLERQQIQVTRLSLDNSAVKLYQKSTSASGTSATNAPASFVWPPWQITAEALDLGNSTFAFRTKASPDTAGVFDPEWVSFQQINLGVKDLSFEPGQILLDLNQLSFRERSGLTVERLQFNGSFTEKGIQADDLSFRTPQNSLNGDAAITYESLDQLMNTPDSIGFSADLADIALNLKELALFNPALLENEYTAAIASKTISGSLKADGSLSRLEVPKVNLTWGDSTSLVVSGVASNLTDPEKLFMDLDTVEVLTVENDLARIVSEQMLGIEYPDSMVVRGTYEGGTEQFEADLNLETGFGNLSVQGFLSMKDTMAFNADLKVKNLLLDSLLQIQGLDTLTFSAQLKGSGNSINTLNARLTTDFERLRYNDYDLSEIDLKGEITNGQGNVDLIFKDRNLDMDMTTFVELDSVSPRFVTNVDVAGAALQPLGLTVRDIRAALELNATFEGNGREFDLRANVEDAVAVYLREAYNFGSFNLLANATEDTLNVTLSSSVIFSRIRANKTPEDLFPAFQRQFEAYLNSGGVSQYDTISDPAIVEMNTVITDAPILSEVFVPGIKRMDSIYFNLAFNEAEGDFHTRLIAPAIQYENITVDSVELNIDGRQDDFNFDFGWAGVEASPVSIDRTSISGKLKEGLLKSEFTLFDDSLRLVHIDAELQRLGDTLKVHVVPQDLVFNGKEWQISEDNELTYAPEYIGIDQFIFSRNAQSLTLGTDLPGQEHEHVGALFENFQLATFTNLLNADRPVASGKMNGNLVVEYPFGDYGLLAALGIENLAAMEVPLGDFRLKASSDGPAHYVVDLSVKGENADLELKGGYDASAEGANLNLNLDINELKMLVLDQFSNGVLSESSGSLSANMDVSGLTSDPRYSGTLKFNQAATTINQLNARFLFKEEELKLDNSGLFLNDFTITDRQNDNFTVDGKILTEDIYNPTFDLTVRTEDFNLVNSTKEDSDLFYGKVNMDAELTIKGDLNIPLVRGELSVNDASNLTVVVPETQLELKAREGVVLFVNRKNPDDILTRVTQSENSAVTRQLAGYDIGVNVRIGKNSTFNIIIDEKTGDMLSVAGTGNFNLNLEPNGRTSLSGKYSLTDGYFETNLYGLVQRRFEIAAGSNIQWSGDPFDAELDVKAIYNLKTSAAPLMSVRTSAENSQVAASYQERLPFEVIILVEGALLKPEISFDLSMPEGDRGALGGDVYQQVQQLNTQEDELNKQVFSLLVLGRFFPDASSDGSAGGPASLALDNVNKVLSSQLNTYGNKIFGGTGVELGFDLNSTGTGSQASTQLDITASKRLFNDRLIVEVGSEVDVAGGQNSSEGTPIIGNVSVEYLITPDGRLRLQGFSRNQYEGVIDGQLAVSGIAFIFQREFNKLKELWTRQVNDEVDKKKKKKKGGDENE